MSWHNNIIKYNKLIIDYIIADGEANIVSFGKYSGYNFNYVYENQCKSYCRWFIKNIDIKKHPISKKLSMLLFKQWLEKVSLYDSTNDPRSCYNKMMHNDQVYPTITHYIIFIFIVIIITVIYIFTMCISSRITR